MTGPEIIARPRGYAETIAALKKLGPAVELRVMPAVTYAGAAAIREEARKTAPRAADHAAKVSKKTGRMLKPLYRSIRVIRRNPRRARAFLSSVGPGAAYWGMFLEFGTSKMSARPWLRPALSAARGAAYAAAFKRLRFGVFAEAAKLAVKSARRGR